jgi:glycosyltransferase involved in cell wall biosynthesis
VRILNDAGIEAHVVHKRSGFGVDWFEHGLSPLALETGLRVRTDDRIVFPDGLLNLLPEMRPRNPVLLLLGPAYFLQSRDLPRLLDLARKVPVLTSSTTFRDFLSWTLGRDVGVVRTGIDTALFHPPSEPKDHQVAYLRRKGTLDKALDSLIGFLAGRFPALRLAPIEGLPMAEYAAVLRRSQVFVNTSVLQGFPRSTLEAMACGCVCLGYTSLCGADLVRPAGPERNYVQVEDLNVLELARTLADVTERIVAGDPELESVRANGLAAAAAHTPEAEAASVVGWWKALLSARRS